MLTWQPCLEKENTPYVGICICNKASKFVLANFWLGRAWEKLQEKEARQKSERPVFLLLLFEVKSVREEKEKHCLFILERGTPKREKGEVKRPLFLVKRENPPCVKEERGRERRHFPPFSIHLSAHDCPNIFLPSETSRPISPPTHTHTNIFRRKKNRGNGENIQMSLAKSPPPPPFHERAACPKRKGRPPFLKTEETEKVFLFLLFFFSIAILQGRTEEEDGGNR